MISRGARSLLLASALLLAGCSLSLQEYVQRAREQSAQITQCQQVYGFFGNPHQTQALPDGSQFWTYAFKIPRAGEERTVIFACDAQGEILAYTIRNSALLARPPLRQRMSQSQ